MIERSRRRLLIAWLGVLGSLAGCLGGTDGDAPGDGTTTGRSPGTPSEPEPQTPTGGAGTQTGATVTTRESTAAGTDTPADPGTATDDLDLREANVVGVEFEAGEDYRFSVTLFHDDDGEEGYANWWQVERIDGTQLGRRKLLHAHSTDPFTRSETISVPDGVTCVVVRGHDQTHGYGGRATLVDLESGATRAVDQGTEPRSFDESDCP